jgi:PAS domain S-box-containing protein
MTKRVALLACCLLPLCAVAVSVGTAPAGLLPHGVCYSWNSTLIGLHLISDALIGAAYFSIPPALLYFARRRTDLPFSWIFVLFGLFIVACGATHWMEVWTLWYPQYWLSGMVKVVTAAASVPTAIALVWLIPRALVIPSAGQLRLANETLEREMQERKRAEAALRESHLLLEQRVAERTGELKAANDALHRHTEWLHTTLSSIGDAVIATDAAGRVLFMNPMAEQATGWTQGEAHHRPLREVFHTVDEQTRERVEDPVTRAIAQGSAVSLANRALLLGRHGQELPIDDSAAPIRDSSAEVTGAVLVFRDISERRRAEEERVEALATLRSFLQSSPLGMAVVDKDMRFLVINDALAAMNGVSAGEQVGRTSEEMVPALHPVAAPILEQVRKTGQPVLGREFSAETGRTPGERRWWEESWFPIAGSHTEVRRVGVIVNETTERRRAEEALRHHRELLQKLIDTIPVMITQYDPETKVLALNRAFERTIGWTAEEAAGISLMEACYPDPGLREQAQRFMDSTSEGWMDIPMRTRDGRVVETSWANVRLSDQTRVGIGIDISQRKRYERELEEADRRKDAFLATLSHELRNPLAPIRSSVAILHQAGSGLEPQLIRAREVLERQVAHMSRLLDDLLDMSRITRNRLELRKQRVALSEVIASSLETSQPLIQAANHSVSVEQPPTPIHLAADPVRLAQVFSNLLNNAAKYTDPGGCITVVVRPGPAQVAVTIRDTGIGLSPEAFSCIFDMFAQVSPSMDRSRDGLGIGLSLARALVELHGGEIHAHSEGPGRGSEFTVQLPLDEDALPLGAQPVSVPPLDASARRPKRIMVIDDNVDAAESLTLLLQLMGHEVQAAHDGHSALAASEAFRPHVVLLDIGLPGMNGYEVAGRIRAQPWGRDIVLVAVTGWGRDEDRAKALASGFDQHATKPLDVERLKVILSALPTNT